MGTENSDAISKIKRSATAVLENLLATILIFLIGMIAFSVGFSKTENLENSNNWHVWIAVFGVVAALLFAANFLRLAFRWLSQSRIRANSGEAIGLVIASILMRPSSVALLPSLYLKGRLLHTTPKPRERGSCGPEKSKAERLAEPFNAPSS